MSADALPERHAEEATAPAPFQRPVAGASGSLSSVAPKWSWRRARLVWILTGLSLVSAVVVIVAGVPDRHLAEAPAEWQGLVAVSELVAIAIVFGVAFAVAVLVRRRAASAAEPDQHLREIRPAALAASVAGFLALSVLLLVDPDVGAAARASATLAWIASAALVVTQLLRAVAPAAEWLGLLRKERAATLFALVACLAWLAAPAVRSLWGPLGALTFHAVGALLERFYDGVVLDAEARRLAVGDFRVVIGAPCSGYEGMGLITAFLGGYCWLYRRELRFPRALLLLPLGAALAWLANIGRIAALVAIGASFSQQVARDGFHSRAGWISFVVLAVGTVAVAHRVPWFAAQPPATESAAPAAGRRSEALLLPLVALLAATLLTSALSAGFDWAYPLRVAAVGGALWLCRRHYRLAGYRPGVWPFAIGAAVFALWIVLVPASPAADTAADEALAGAPKALALAWLAARVIGASAAVPIAEELAFRGYLLARLAVRDGGAREVPFSWPALAVSSVAFGALHSAWLAGTLAGAAFAAARYRRGNLGDAVVAHAVTNGLLSLYVLATGHWSLL